jgi:hypothetical protein
LYDQPRPARVCGNIYSSSAEGLSAEDGIGISNLSLPGKPWCRQDIVSYYTQTNWGNYWNALETSTVTLIAQLTRVLKKGNK